MYQVDHSIDNADSVDQTAGKDAIVGIDFTGITGTITIDEYHNPVKSMIVIETVDGVYANATRVNP